MMRARGAARLFAGQRACPHRRGWESNVATGEHKRPHGGSLKRDALESPVPDALIAREHDPAFCTREREPGGVVRTLGQVPGKALYDSAGGGKRFAYRIAVERLLQENRERFYRLAKCLGIRGPLCRLRGQENSGSEPHKAEPGRFGL